MAGGQSTGHVRLVLGEDEEIKSERLRVSDREREIESEKKRVRKSE